MDTIERYAGLQDVARFWLCRASLRLTRWAYRPFPIVVLVRRVDGNNFYVDQRLAAGDSPRLVIDAECTTCGDLFDHRTQASDVPQLALKHVAETGHVVVLNGTADAPDENPTLPPEAGDEPAHA